MMDKDNCGCTPPPVVGAKGHWECTPIPDTCKPVELTDKLVKEMYENNVNTEAFTTTEKAQLKILHDNVGGPNGAIKEIIAGTHIAVDNTDPTKPVVSTDIAVGPQGIQGDPGATGPTGPDGPTGPQGPQGPKGPKGEGIVIKGADTKANIYLKSGKIGDTWIITDVTDNGKGLVSSGKGSGQANWAMTPAIQGPIGATGSTGAAGAQGPAGNTGPIGPQGPKGADGVDGVGKDGHDGANGKDGTGVTIKGSAPKADILTKQAPAGDMWLISDTGPKHGHGLVSDGATPTVWTDVGAIQGPEGPQGQVGPVGTKGPQGDAGAQGIGTKGDTGIQGPQGTDGKVGPAGTQGVPGSAGAKGDKGDQGNNGLQGSHGDPGPAGPAGTGVTIKGSANLPTIQATPGAAGDMWICTDVGANLGHGYVSDGQGAGASHWTDVGTIAGPKGDKGDKGDQGTAGADSTVAGPAGQQGPQGNQGPQGTATVDFASDAETAAGTVADKATTPSSVRKAYVPRDGGTFTGVVKMPTNCTINHSSVSKSAIIQFYDNSQLGLVGYQDNVKAVMMYNKTSGASVRAGDTNEVKLVTAGGTGDITAMGNLGVTGNATVAAKLTAGSIETDSYIAGTVKPYRVGRYGKLVYMYNMTGKCYVDANDTGDINMVTPAGKKAKVNGKGIVTGTLSGTTLNLTL